jgi:hypothetical protein
MAATSAVGNVRGGKLPSKQNRQKLASAKT